MLRMHADICTDVEDGVEIGPVRNSAVGTYLVNGVRRVGGMENAQCAFWSWFAHALCGTLLRRRQCRANLQ